MVTRRSFCATAAGFAALPAWSAAGKALVLVTEEQAKRIKADDAVRGYADAALQQGPWSVTTKRPADVDATPNDYYSEGPYWWPDPKNPKGPYIRKDGERNPGRFD